MPPLNSFSKSCLALALSQLLTVPAHAAYIQVNTSSDSVVADQLCSLREAIISANSNSSDGSGCASGELNSVDQITFDSMVFPSDGENSITLTSSLPNITSSLTIVGQGNGGLTIDANGTGHVMWFEGGHGYLDNINITGGSAFNGGGLIANNNSVVTINHSSVTDNTASNRAGGIYARMSSNLTVKNSTISGNTAISAAGAYARYSGLLAVENSIISNNSATDGAGLAVRLSTATILDSTIKNNSSSGNSGGIAILESAVLTLERSTVSNNTATSNGGGIGTSQSILTLINSTLSGNSSTNTAGAVYVNRSTVTLISSTVSGNSSTRQGGALNIDSRSSAHLSNSIIAGNQAANYSEIYSTGTVTSSHSVFGDSSHTTAQAQPNVVTSETDIIAFSDGPEPKALTAILSPLGNNGGTTQTHALVQNSPAIDNGDSAVCASSPVLNLDQRSKSRLIGDACDIGSFEYTDESLIFVIPLKGKALIIDI